jgi:hypothetical protein
MSEKTAVLIALDFVGRGLASVALYSPLPRRATHRISAY